MTSSCTCAGPGTTPTGTSPSRSTSTAGRGRGASRYHFLRLFTATYGITPAAYVSQRRIERAQDLLRSTNLTVTEVCHAVGFTSLGSFSSRFREIVGETPSEFQRRYADGRAPHPRAATSSCPAWPRASPTRRSAIGEKHRAPRPLLRSSHDHQHLHRQRLRHRPGRVEEFYTDVLGFEAKDDITLGDDYRWCTVVHPTQPELQVNLAVPGPPLAPEIVEAIAARAGRGRHARPSG